MRRAVVMGIVSAVAALAMVQSASAGQAPGALSAPDVAVSGHDRVYAAEQFSKTVSVLINRPGLCTVQDVKGTTLSAAKQKLTHADCRVGREVICDEENLLRCRP